MNPPYRRPQIARRGNRYGPPRPACLRFRHFRIRRDPQRARDILQRHIDDFFDLFITIMNQADRLMNQETFEEMTNMLRDMVEQWEGALQYRMANPLQ